MSFDALQLTEQTIANLQSLKSHYHQSKKDMVYCEQEYSDLTHALELLDFNAAEGYKLSRRLKENRQRRRAAKEQVEQLQTLNDLLIKYPNLLSDLQNIRQKTKEVRQTQANRCYTPKTDASLKLAFEKATLKHKKMRS